MEKYKSDPGIRGIGIGTIKAVGCRDYFMYVDEDEEDLKANVCHISDLKEKCIVIAENIPTAELLKVDPKIVDGFIFGEINTHSNMYVMAHMMNIPTVIVDFENFLGLWSCDGIKAAIIGGTGEIFLDPEEEFINRILFEKMDIVEDVTAMYYLGKDDITEYGRKLYVFADAYGVDDCKEAEVNDAKGVGIYRTEYDYLKMKTPPSEEQLFKIYKKAVKTVKGKPIIFQLADFSEDKIPEYFTSKDLEKHVWEENQIRALLRVAEYGDVMLLIPKVTDCLIFRSRVEYITRIATKLNHEEIKNSLPAIGAMVEELLYAREVRDILGAADFICVSTNNYLAHCYEKSSYLEKAIDEMLKFTEIVVKEAHAKEKWVGLYGELSSDSHFLTKVLNTGVDVISVPPHEVLKMRQNISKQKLDHNDSGEDKS